MRVLVTGSAGFVGEQVMADLERAGHEASGFDLRHGDDVLDPGAVERAARGCGGIVHAAARMDPADDPSRLMAVNVLGTWNVLEAARGAGVPRVVFLSSVDALGLFKGERAPDYLPIDDAHPCYPATAYGLSKRLAEQVCEQVATASGLSVVCLRPPGVWSAETYAWILEQRAKRASFEWDPFWEYGAFIDVRDLSQACLAALRCEVASYACVLVSAPDLTTSGRTAHELARSLHPDVDWRGGDAYVRDPYASLLDCRRARDLLGRSPQHGWQSTLDARARG